MKNIYQIQQDLLAIFDELEENGGELTPELEEQLAISQDDFKNKVKSYIGVIHQYNSDLAAIKEEKSRLDALKKNKEKSVDRLKNILVDAIEKFGDTKKSGVKFVDYGTGQVSIRQSQSVEVDEEIVNHVAIALHNIFGIERYNNQLDVIDRIDKDALIDMVATTPRDTSDEDNEGGFGFNVTEDDLNHIMLDVACLIPLSDIINGKDGFKAVKEMFKYSQTTAIDPKIIKSELKEELKENGSCAPNIARLVTNKNIAIK